MPPYLGKLPIRLGAVGTTCLVSHQLEGRYLCSILPGASWKGMVPLILSATNSPGASWKIMVPLILSALHPFDHHNMTRGRPLQQWCRHQRGKSGKTKLDCTAGVDPTPDWCLPYVPVTNTQTEEGRPSSSLVSTLFSSNTSRTSPTGAQSFIGVNYGEVADNLPPPTETVKLLQSTTIQKVRLYGADPAIIKALANTNIGIVIGAGNGDIPALASDPNFAGQWVSTNVLAYYPGSKIIVVTVGNEVMTSKDQGLISQILPAMQNLQNALNAASLGGKIKVSTVHSMAVLTQSDPPSSGAFNPSFGDTMRAMLAFMRATGSPFMINPYPFFAYTSDTRAETLAFCLFQPNAGRVDSGTGIKYMNMFDAQVDAIRSALNAMGFKDIEIVVAETGWPYKGDPNEVGPSIDNAKAYNGNLINHLRSMVGTPLMPGKSVDTYIFAIYNEDLKPGPGSERSFGLFNPDLSLTYDAGLSKSSQVRISIYQLIIRFNKLAV
ncbi:hypothetical protein TEA_001218 [Camellia sinensis var. sinensis]|uniref:glucan endo-1,3-beta-D-glucosidase n=1 Tax=Camellia sinensis var. sinensis TaxID=542762 RepID=A0A4S4EQI1_CAMSN|nr:hypothetical protein TEA_001218 [Camellia sinensis var. sinensis]